MKTKEEIKAHMFSIKEKLENIPLNQLNDDQWLYFTTQIDILKWVLKE